MGKIKHKCIVCGRTFPNGQGIIINYGDLELKFHSNRCASKFLRLLLERVPHEELKEYVKRITEELKEKISLLEKSRVKSI